MSDPRHVRRRGNPTVAGLAITTLLLGIFFVMSPTENAETLRRLVGMGDQRLGAPPRFEDGRGSYEFALTQPGGNEPVGYDPCRVIEVAVNPEGAPDNYEALVETAISRTSDATGLVFERLPDTDDRNFADRWQRFGDRRPPVLVGWADSDEVPELAGDVAGVGGSTAVSVGSGRRFYVTGMVVLDSEQFADFDEDEEPFAQAIVDHEFGHLVGLGHVDDPGELMNAENLGRVSYGPGDREGLARLGSIDC
ncbi:hypothetical protein ACFP3Q_14525 [Nocardioides sp. GCM10027113]|uniref:hypothetical protein n=1 Tax=unclassified Nocardioides TaxID=2615069 RepID=UPI0036148B5C